MNFLRMIVPVMLLAAGPGSREQPLVCRLDALKPAERERHEVLAASLHAAVSATTELSSGYELTLDLSRLPADAKGSPPCVVEVAEWAELESRCCPFLDFEIGLRDGGRLVTLRLTGGQNVKAFLKDELGLGRATEHYIEKSGEKWR